MPSVTSVSIVLEFPVQLADRKISEVTMRRPVMRDMLKHNISPQSGLAEDMALIADLCGLAVDDLESFDTMDYEQLQKQLLRFRGLS